ncbi:MAG: zf-HC2 domain-containing protein [Actinomycetota bacterium]
MTPPADHVRSLLGAFALGHLDEDETEAVRAHLEGCAACRAEADELLAVAGVLPLADPSRLGAQPDPPDDLLDGVLERIDRERRERHHTRQRSLAIRIGVAATIAVVVVAALVVLLPGERDGSGGEIVALASRVEGAVGEAIVHRDPASTWVELNTSGLEAGETYAVWLEESGSGERAPAGSFTGVEGDLYISLYSTLPRDDAASIGVSTLDGEIVMRGDLAATPAD